MTTILDKISKVSSEYSLGSPLWFTPNGDLHGRIYTIFASILYYLLGCTWLEEDFSKCMQKLKEEITPLGLNSKTPEEVQKIQSLSNKLFSHLWEHISEDDPAYQKCFTPLNEMAQKLNSTSFSNNPVALSSSSTDPSHLSSFFTHDRDPGGLNNLGLTCFANASFQAIRRSTLVQDALAPTKPLVRKPEETNNDILYFSRKILKKKLWELIYLLNHEEKIQPQQDFLKTTLNNAILKRLKIIFFDLNTLLPKYGIKFQFINQQHDAQEFLGHLFNLLDCENLIPYTLKSFLSGRREGTQKFWGIHIKEKSEGSPAILSLVLKDSDHTSMQNAVDHFFDQEEIHGAKSTEDNSVQFTPEYEQFSLALKTQEPPQELFLQIKRYNNYGQKNSRAIENWDKPIQMHFYHVNEDTNQLYQDLEIEYRPVDIICHHGNSFESGHYTSAHIDYDPSGTQIFKLTQYNDSKVYSVETTSKALEAFSRECYLIRYEIVPSQDKK